MRDYSKMLAAAFLLLATAGWNQNAFASKLYRWVDGNGQVHYGDSIPPKYSKTDREILNERGIRIKTLPRELTQQELLAAARASEVAELDRLRAEEIQTRDNVLINTYLSVEEIQALRDRRKELLDGRIRVTEIYLASLRDKLAKLQKDASRFQPYNSDPDAPLIHDWLAKELANTMNSILVYDQTLINTRNQQTELVAKFDNDIVRFEELTNP
jgi:hypothetical protein